jgi:ribosomal protein S18 acetylase RimI-like enzyme
MPLAAELSPALRIEPAAEVDRQVLYAPYKAALHAYVDWAWGWNEEKERFNFFERMPLSDLCKLTLHGECIGGFCLGMPAGQDWHLRTFFLAPSVQRQGIGTAVLLHLMRQAKSQQRGMTLHVIHINPAKRLYERLGFQTVRQEDKTCLMRLPA